MLKPVVGDVRAEVEVNTPTMKGCCLAEKFIKIIRSIFNFIWIITC